MLVAAEGRVFSLSGRVSQEPRVATSEVSGRRLTSWCLLPERLRGATGGYQSSRAATVPQGKEEHNEFLHEEAPWPFWGFAPPWR